MAHIVIAEDDELQAEVLRRYLEQDGHTTTLIRDGRDALAEIRRSRPDLALLDVMMPGMDGLEVCRRLRQESDVLILMLTARSTEADLLRGLQVGADDYLSKPYSPRELVARVRTLLRRVGRPPASEGEVRRVGGLTVDPVRHEVRVDGLPVVCTPGEFEILVAMATHPGRVFSRQQLLELITTADRRTTERTIDVHVRNLRKKIESDPGRPARLLTVFGVGYKMSSTWTGQANGV